MAQEELTQPIQEETNSNQAEQINKEELAQKNYENLQNLVKQQQEQIQQLIKNQELNKKINQQLSETNQQLMENRQENKHWVDEALENFQYNSGFDLNNIYFQKGNTEQIATWYLQHLRDQGCSNAEISHRMNNIFKSIEGEAQIHEDIN